MSARPKDKPTVGTARRDPVSRLDPVSLIVAIGLIGLGAGGVLAIFSGPLLALFAH